MRTSTSTTTYRSATVLAIVATLMLIWLSLGVGIIGADGDPANAMYAAVITVGIIGGIASRFRSAGMALTLILMALAQGIIATIALAAGLGQPWSPPAELLVLNGFFIAMFMGAAFLFQKAAELHQCGD